MKDLVDKVLWSADFSHGSNNSLSFYHLLFMVWRLVSGGFPSRHQISGTSEGHGHGSGLENALTL